ncbi:MAG: hypothetical protein M5R36_14350 [Deltaproteobacteria bacterium]|nr:hypothetical protein [Deltaproteobacteria bacterium]
MDDDVDDDVDDDTGDDDTGDDDTGDDDTGDDDTGPDGPIDLEALDFDINWAVLGWDAGGVDPTATLHLSHSMTGTPGTFTEIAMFPPTTLFYVHRDIGCGVTHYYRMTAAVGPEESEPSNVAAVRTNHCTHGQWSRERLVNGYRWDNFLPDRFLHATTAGETLVLPANPLAVFDNLTDSFLGTTLHDVTTPNVISLAADSGGKLYAVYSSTELVDDTPGQAWGLYYYDLDADTSTDLTDFAKAVAGASLVFDASDVPHIFASAYEQSGFIVHLWNDGTWHSEIVGAGINPHAAVTADGTLHVLARQSSTRQHFIKPAAGTWSAVVPPVAGPTAVNGSGQLVSVEANGSDAVYGTYNGSTWSIETVAGLGFNVSVAIDGSGDPVLAGFSQDTDSWVVKVARPATDAFAAETAASGAYDNDPDVVPDMIDVAVDGDGEIHVAFEVVQVDASNLTEIRVVRSTPDVDGWDEETVVEQTLPGYSMDAEHDGNTLYLAYMNFGADQVRFATYLPTALAWDDETIFAGTTPVKIALNGADVPYAAVINGDGELSLGVETIAAAGWSFDIMYTPTEAVMPFFDLGYDTNESEFVAAVIDRNPDADASGDAVVIRGTTGSFNDETAVGGTVNGFKISLAMHGAYTHVAYNSDGLGGNVYHATNAAGSWTGTLPGVQTVNNMFDLAGRPIDTEEVKLASGDNTDVFYLGYDDGSWSATPTYLWEDYLEAEPGGRTRWRSALFRPKRRSCSTRMRRWTSVGFSM